MLGIADAGKAMRLHDAAMILIARAFMKRVEYPRLSMTVFPLLGLSRLD
jgi:hypothetical protein